MNETQFIEKCKEIGIELSDKQCQQFRDYATLLVEWNEKMNLTAITQMEEIYEKHFYDSIVPFVGVDFESLCDVGTGAGFPGVPVSIVWPEKQVTLIEPLAKRCRFLEEVKQQLGLTVQIVNQRSEEVAKTYREHFDVLTSRAVARLTILLELCTPLLKVDGLFIALKGKSAPEELVNAQKAMDVLHLNYIETKEVQIADALHQNMYFKKVKKTDPKYPRNYGQIKKKPLGE